MGTYVNLVHRSNPIKVEIDGETQTAYLLKYLYKPSWSWREFNRPYEAIIARSYTVWGDQVPEFVVCIFNKVEEGDNVYRWNTKSLIWTDSSPIPATLLGTLKRVGRKWKVVPQCSSPNPIPSDSSPNPAEPSPQT